MNNLPLTRLNTEFTKGMGKCNDEFVIILDLNKVFSAGEISLAPNMSETPRVIEEPKVEECEAEVV
jgi:hypothetical protein